MPVICKECKESDKTSKVNFTLDSYTKFEYQPYYDETGKYHRCSSYHEVKANFECTNNHKWENAFEHGDKIEGVPYRCIVGSAELLEEHDYTDLGL